MSDEGIEWLLSEGLERISSAPTDGTVIGGVNSAMDEAEVRFVEIAPGVSGWVVSEDTSNPNWHGFNMFYPVVWYPINPSPSTQKEL